MAWRPHSFAKTDVKNLNAWGICDRCGLLYNLNDLVWQHDWRGAKITNIKLRVCRRTCVDVPYEGNRPLKLPPDPLPVRDPRPIRYAIDEGNTVILSPPPTPTPTPEPFNYTAEDGVTQYVAEDGSTQYIQEGNAPTPTPTPTPPPGQVNWSDGTGANWSDGTPIQWSSP